MKRSAFWALAGALMMIGMVRMWGPLSTVRGQSERMAELRATRASLLAEQVSLERERRFLATDAGREAAARRMGYVRPGERRVVFTPAASKKAR